MRTLCNLHDTSLQRLPLLLEYHDTQGIMPASGAYGVRQRVPCKQTYQSDTQTCPWAEGENQLTWQLPLQSKWLCDVSA